MVYIGTDDSLKALKITVKQCPITGGRKTKMTKEQFKALCKHHQRRAKEGDRDPMPGSYRAGVRGVDRHCLKCQGKRPKELSIVERWW